MVCDAGVRLDGYDHFPWNDATQAIATLDFPFSLAITSRWDDENIAHMNSLLPSVLEAALSLNVVLPTQVSSFSPLLDEFDEELVCQVLDKVGSGDNVHNRNILIENIAKDELLWFGKGTRSRILEKLNSIAGKSENGFWKMRLIKTTEFHQIDKVNSLSTDNQIESHGRNEKKDPLADADFSAFRFTSGEELNIFVTNVYEAARFQGEYVSINTIIERIRTAIQVRDRKSYLDALGRLNFRYLSGYELGL